MKIGDTTITDPSEYEINPTNPTTEITLMSGDRRFHEKTSNNNIYFHWNYLPVSELETMFYLNYVGYKQLRRHCLIPCLIRFYLNYVGYKPYVYAMPDGSIKGFI